MPSLDQGPRERSLGFPSVERLAFGADGRAQRVYPFGRHRRVHFEPGSNQIVRQAHRLAEHGPGVVVYRDVVADGLRLLVHAIEAGRDPRRDDDLGFLARSLLKSPAHGFVEELVGSDYCHIRSELDRIPALKDRVEHLVHTHFSARLETGAEHVPREELGRGDAVGELHEVDERRLVPPLGVAPHFEDFRGVGDEHCADLPDEGLGVAFDVLAARRRSRSRSPRRIAHERREVADQELHEVPALLHLAHHPQIYRVSQVQERRGHVGPEFYLELPVRIQKLSEFREGENAVRGSGEEFH